MPRKTNEEINETNVTQAKQVVRKSSVKSTKKATSNVATKVEKEVSTKTSKKSTKKSTKKSATSKSTKSVKNIKASKTKTTNISEYYDLPFGYHETVVKILAQTPSVLFVYWEVSEKDAKNLTAQYGNNFFNETSPVLLVTNKTKNYQFEVEINDYANSWYFHIPDSDCEYSVALMRKAKNEKFKLENGNNTISIVSSNSLEAPNDHILFEKLGSTVFFQNVKNNKVESKNIASVSLMHNIGRIYNIYDLYKEIYKNELNGNVLDTKLSSSTLL